MDVPNDFLEYNLSIDYKNESYECQESLSQYESINSKLILAMIVLFSLELLFSIIGLVLNIAFICRKKTNFLVRLFVYLSVATTLLVGLAIGLVMRSSIHRPDHMYRCTGVRVSLQVISSEGLRYLVWISSALSFTAYSILLWKLCAQTCSCCMRRQPCCVNRTPKQQVILEVVFLLLTMVVPIPFIGLDSSGLGAPSIVLPVATLLTLIGYVFLLVWFCVRRKLIARRRCVKELVMWFMYFIVTILSIAYFVLSIVKLSKDTSIGLIIVVTLSAIYPYCVLVYMWHSFRTKRGQNVNNRIQVDGQIQVDETNLVTAHPLTWFSLTTTDGAV